MVIQDNLMLDFALVVSYFAHYFDFLAYEVFE
jgi:hypothetical protein